jgi:hypothetical protein
MDVKEKLQAIKVLLGMHVEAAAEPTGTVETTEPVEVKKDATLKDGTIVRYENELAVGSELYVVTPEGEAPAPDGAHEMEDGTIVEVASGVITAITPKAENPAPEQSMSAPDVEAMKAEMAAVKAEVESLKASFAAIKDATEKELNSIKEAFAKTVELVELFDNTPAAKPEAPINTTFGKQVDKESNLNKVIEAVQAMIKK